MSATFLDWLCYQIVMIGPLWFAGNPKTRFGARCISRAGTWAYRHDAAAALAHQPDKT